MQARTVKGTLVLPAGEPGAIERVAGILKEGGIVAFPTETVYGLGADGFNPEAVGKVFAAKGRPADKALIMHLSGPEMLGLVVADVPVAARALIEAFWPGPLTLVLKKTARVPAIVTAGRDGVAVRCPAHPVAISLIHAVGGPLAAPSANRSGRPSPTTAEDVLEDMAGRIDAVLDGGPTGIGMESTVVDMIVSPPAILRPGGIPVEQLARFLPGLRLPPDLGTDAAQVRPAPGTSSRHCAPRARLVLVEGTDMERVVEEVRRRAELYARDGSRVALLATAETAGAYYGLGPAVRVVEVGTRQDLASVAGALFRTLRSVDREGVRFVLAEGFPDEGLGTAIMHRLRRASEEVVTV